MNHLDLFSGTGGFAIACDMVWDNVNHVFCEIKPYLNHFLRQRYPNAPIYSDIKELSGHEIRNKQGTIDLITGGDPCQPHSIAGKRQGKDDPRYLWPEMLRIVKQARPRWIINENVVGSIATGVASQKIDDLESAGYTTQAFIIPAEAIGARHERNRIWILSHANSTLETSGISNTIKEKAFIEHVIATQFNFFSRISKWKVPYTGIYGVVNGLREWVDPFEALGNSIVPELAASLMYYIKQVDIYYKQYEVKV